MALCGSSSCGCGLVAIPAASGDLDGEFPTIDIDGSGEAGDPWNLRPSDPWAERVASYLQPTPWFLAPLNPLWRPVPGNPPKFRRVGDMVQLRGAVLRSPLSNPSAPGNPAIFFLPTGFRPDVTVVFIGETGGATTGKTFSWGLNYPSLAGGVYHAEPTGAYLYLTINAEFYTPEPFPN